MSTTDYHLVTRLHDAIVPPDIAGAATSALTCSSTEFVAGGSNGVQSTRATHTFYERDVEGYVKIPAGLVQRVVDACELQSIQASVIDRSRWPVLEQATAKLPDIVNDNDRSLLNAVAASPRGQIIANVRDHLKLVISLCRAFAAARILIVTANQKQRDKLCCKLSAKLKRPVSTQHGIRWGASNRVTLVTADFFTGISVVNVDFDLVIFTHPNGVTGNHAFETASQLNHELIFCLVPPSYRPDVLAQLRLEAVCGQVIQDDGETDVNVQVVKLSTPAIHVPPKLTPLERKRIAIWRNDPRNDFIADIALAIVNGDLETFSHRSEFLPEHIESLNQYQNPSVAILVESTEHGRELQRCLPQWSLHTAIPDKDGTLDSGSCHRSIVTETYASAGIHTDILIRTTGTTSPLVVKGFPAIGHGRPFVLFDLADGFDAQARRDTGQRIDDYESRGWIVSAGNNRVVNSTREITTRQRHSGATA